MPGFILRIDDCGWVPPDKKDDVGLEYFRAFREASGLAGLPVYYGFIPLTLHMRDIAWLHENLTGGERISIHGWSHARGEEVTAAQIKRAADCLIGSFDMARQGFTGERTTYIAPFNAYTEQTLVEFGNACPNGVFFGGFPDDPQSVNLGPAPAYTRDFMTTHVPASRDLYGRAAEIIEATRAAIMSQAMNDPPLVVTLHATWEEKTFGSVRALVDLLKPKLVNIGRLSD